MFTQCCGVDARTLIGGVRPLPARLDGQQGLALAHLSWRPLGPARLRAHLVQQVSWAPQVIGAIAIGGVMGLRPFNYIVSCVWKKNCVYRYVLYCSPYCTCLYGFLLKSSGIEEISTPGSETGSESVGSPASVPSRGFPQPGRNVSVPSCGPRNSRPC